MKPLLVFAWMLFAAGEAAQVAPALDPLSVLGPISQAGAVGVLAWVAWSQRQEIRDLRVQHCAVIDKLCERWDRQEMVRHDDNRVLSEALTGLVAHCKSRNGGGI
ncbi:MAG: hypothetical protein ACOY3P_24255 [Planctomycetota bacterium]